MAANEVNRKNATITDNTVKIKRLFFRKLFRQTSMSIFILAPHQFEKFQLAGFLRYAAQYAFQD